MEFQKLSAPSLKELFILELESKILSGELQIGEKLPSERDLATSMQVSRAVVNAGILEMEKKGFLTIKPRVGTFVCDYRKYGTLETLVSIMKFNGGTLADDEVRSVLELRWVLVSLAADLALERASDEELALLTPIMASIEACHSKEELVQEVFHFYHELAFISGNSLLPLFFISFKELVCKLWLRFAINYGNDALITATREFYELLLKRDPSALTYVKESSKQSIYGDKQIYKSASILS